MLTSILNMLSRGEYVTAENQCRKLLSSQPTPDLYLILSEALLRQSKLQQAIENLDDAAIKFNDFSPIWLRRGQIALQLRDRSGALKNAATAAKYANEDPLLNLAIAQLIMQCDKPQDALPILERAYYLSPKNVEILYEIALCNHFISEPDRSLYFINELLNILPAHGPALHLRSSLRKWNDKSNNVKSLLDLLDNNRLNRATAVFAGFAIAKEYEDLGDYQHSFEQLMRACKIKRESLNYNVDNDVADIMNICQKFTSDSMSKITSKEQGNEAIFVLGLPRTGTTLIEKLLCQNDNVCAVGEITDFPTLLQKHVKNEFDKGGYSSSLDAALNMDYSALGEDYLSSARQLADKPYFIDKLPFNFRYIGLIKKALPDAKIIHVRRNPMDAAYAILKTLFYNVYSFSYDLTELGRYVAAYHNLMKHWRLSLPESFFEISYESLVENPEEESLRLFNWVGLEWNKAVLDFHTARTSSSTASSAQVRQPVYRSSVDKWKNLESQLKPLLDELVRSNIVDTLGNQIID